MTSRSKSFCQASKESPLKDFEVHLTKLNVRLDLQNALLQGTTQLEGVHGFHRPLTTQAHLHSTLLLPLLRGFFQLLLSSLGLIYAFMSCMSMKARFVMVLTSPRRCH